MQKNEGQTDRIIRGVVGAVLLIAGLASGGWWRIILVILALALLITAYLGYCHLYTLLKMNTLEKKPAAPEPKPAEQKPPEPPQAPTQPPADQPPTA